MAERKYMKVKSIPEIQNNHSTVVNHELDDAAAMEKSLISRMEREGPGKGAAVRIRSEEAPGEIHCFMNRKILSGFQKRYGIKGRIKEKTKIYHK